MAPVRMRGADAGERRHLIEIQDLVDGAADLFAAQRGDHPLDLAPMAEAHDIAVVAAALGAGGGFEARVVAIVGDEIRGIGKHAAAMNEGHVHRPILTPRRLSRLRTIAVNEPLTMFFTLA